MVATREGERVDIFTTNHSTRYGQLIQSVDNNGNVKFIRSNTNNEGTEEVAVSLRGHVCPQNTSDITLGAGSAFTGDWQDTLDYGTVNIGIKSDVDSAIDGLEIQWAHNIDGHIDEKDVFSITANNGKVFTFGPARRYVRVMYTNGTEPQTLFDLETTLRRVFVKTSSHRVQDPVITEDDAELVTNIPKIQTVDGTYQNVSDNYPMPVKDSDGSHRNAANSIFGDRYIGTRVPTIATQFQYSVPTDALVFDTITTGSYNMSNYMLNIHTGTSSTGHIGVQTKEYLRYIPGYEAYAFFTVIFNTATADTSQRVGIFDYDDGNGNGFFLGYEGTTFGITRRRAGTDYFQEIDVNTVFPSNIGIYNPTLGNVYKISYGYLGFATIHFEVMLPHGGFIELGSIEYPNSSNITHIANTNIPIRAEVTNSGNTTNISLSMGSLSGGIVDGGGRDPMVRWFSFAGDTTNINAGTTTLFHFRNKEIFNGLNNKISSQLSFISSSTDGVKNVAWTIIKNPTITTPGTWTDINTSDSIMEYSTDTISTIGTGSLMIPWKMAKIDRFFEDVTQYILKLNPGETSVFRVTSSASSDVDIGLRWKELF